MVTIIAEVSLGLFVRTCGSGVGRGDVEGRRSVVIGGVGALLVAVADVAVTG